MSPLLTMRLPRRAFLALPFAALAPACQTRDPSELLHVSFDATRELLKRFSEIFLAREERRGVRAGVRASHGGSGKQTRSVLEGLSADLVSLALPHDVDVLADHGWVEPSWRQRLPFDASPFFSTVVLLVRAGNPKSIRGFADLLRDDVEPLTPNPKTSGGARWNHLALFGARLREFGRKQAEQDILRLYSRVPVLPTGARQALTTFTERNIGDVLLAWESEALLATQRFAKGRVEVVYPRASIRCDVPVAVVDRVVDRRGTRALAQRYLEALFEPEAQGAALEASFRPREPAGAPLGAHELELFPASEIDPSWATLHAEHFATGGLFDRAFEARFQ